MINLEKVKLNSINRGRISYDKNNFVTANIVSILVSTPTHLISNNMKHIDVPKTVKYRLFGRSKVKRKQLIDAVN